MKKLLGILFLGLKLENVSQENFIKLKVIAQEVKLFMLMIVGVLKKNL